MQTFNIYTCNHCDRQVIAEEKDNHECKSIKNHKIIAHTLWVSDGMIWYPLKINRKFTEPRKLLSTEKKQEQDSTDNETEPQKV